jgi:hypothetical protein
MAFDDVVRTDFKKLQEIVTKTKPYRGTTDKFPLGNRRYKNRHFVWFGTHADIWYNEGWYSNLCRIHSDESVEFLQDNYYQGANMMMTAMFWPYLTFSTCGSKGGDIVDVPHTKGKEHLLFKGLRIFLKTGDVHPTTPYELSIASLDREKTKAIREKYKEVLIAASAFFKISTVEEIIKAGNIDTLDDEDYFSRLCQSAFARKVIPPYYHGSSYSVERITRRLENNREGILKKVKNSFFQDVYKDEEAFKYKFIPAGSTIPAGNWGVRVIKHF